MTFQDLAADIETAKTALREKSARDIDGVMGGCTSYVQRKLMIGYNRAAVIMERLEAEKFITVPDKRGNRRLIATV